MKVLYILYQLFIALPILLVLTILTAIVTIIGSWIAIRILGILSGKNMVTAFLLCITYSCQGSRTSGST